MPSLWPWRRSTGQAWAAWTGRGSGRSPRGGRGSCLRSGTPENCIGGNCWKSLENGWTRKLLELTSALGSVSQLGDVNVKPLSVPASSGNAWQIQFAIYTNTICNSNKYSGNAWQIQFAIYAIIICNSNKFCWQTSVLKDCMKRPSWHKLRLSRPMNQSGDGTIFVITDIWADQGHQRPDMIVIHEPCCGCRRRRRWWRCCRHPGRWAGQGLRRGKCGCLKTCREPGWKSVGSCLDEYFLWMNILFGWIFFSVNTFDLGASSFDKLANTLVDKSAKGEEREGLFVWIPWDNISGVNH